MNAIEVIKGDITKLNVDAIVNGTTARLTIGGGALDKAIHQAAGPALLEECRRIMDERKTIAAGECVITGAYKLPCKHVLHTAGPVYMGGGWHEAEALAACYRSALQAADAAGLESIAFPNLCTGAHTYPKQAAAEIALQTVRETLPLMAHVKKVVFVCAEDENYAIYTQLPALNQNA